MCIYIYIRVCVCMYYGNAIQRVERESTWFGVVTWTRGQKSPTRYRVKICRVRVRGREAFWTSLLFWVVLFLFLFLFFVFGFWGVILLLFLDGGTVGDDVSWRSGTRFLHGRRPKNGDWCKLILVLIFFSFKEKGG